MNIFDINASGQHALSVFAHSYDEAVRVYMIYWVANLETHLPDLEVKKRNPAWPGLDVRLLAEALALGIVGIGRLDPNHGWVILPADYRDEVQA